jgi:hypothetical protein
MATAEERDARLDKLATTVKEWADAERKRLKSQAALGKAILKSRTGSDRLSVKSVTAVSDLTVDEINKFLTGG